MQLHKHKLVRTVTAFSFAVLLFFHCGLKSSAVQTESISELEAQLTALEAETEEANAHLNELQAEAKQGRMVCDETEEMIGNVQDMDIPVKRESDSENGSVLLYAEKQRRLEAAQAEVERLELVRAEAAASIEAWYAEYYAAQEAARRNAEGMGTGTFVWPVPDYSMIYCNYGYGHRGIDIAGHQIYGEPIVASDSGKVISSGWEGSFGYSVVIDHGNGYVTRYAHASELACEAGDVVAQGQTIAYVGSSGYSTGAHLHFEIIYNDEIQNPNDYV